ncbi:Methyl jasmonate esterase 1 [Linum grandiflorum]
MEEDQKQRHFVLVHGACHGAWCWYKVVPLLEQAGHRVTALDLAASGIDRKQVSDVGSISEYHEPLMEFMESVKEQVVLVGHSMGGLGISVAAMERFPDKVCVGVFVSATMPSPHPGLPYSALMQKVFNRIDYMDNQFSYDDGPDNPPTTVLLGRTAMSTKLYQLSPAEVTTQHNTKLALYHIYLSDGVSLGHACVVQDLTLGMMLIRPVGLFKDSEVDAETVLTRGRYGSVPRVYVVCEEDEMMKVEKQRWMIENNPTDDVKAISGADHMVMFSKPHHLCSYLLEIAAIYV